jgi:hypothetical protein
MIKFYEPKSIKPPSTVTKKSMKNTGKTEAENKKEEDELNDTLKNQENKKPSSVDFNQYIAAIRPPHHKCQIKNFKDLKPIVYSKYENKKSFVSLIYE